MLQSRKRNAALLLLLACTWVTGKEPAVEDEAPLFRLDSRLVVLHATVLDKDGRIVNNLPKSAFQVYEDGVAQQIKVFRQEDAPVSLGLVIDSSASIRESRPRVEAAALALVKASNPGDEVFIVNFSDEAFLDQDFTSDAEALKAGLARAEVRGGTAMRDAIDMAMAHMSRHATKDKKVILVITDGEDNSSRKATMGSLLADAQEHGILIYAIGLLNEADARSAKRAKRDIDAITSATGGQSFYPRDVAEVDRIATQVAHDLRNQYTLAYTPYNAALDGAFRQIKVVVEGPNRPVARTRTGYYSNNPAVQSADRQKAPDR